MFLAYHGSSGLLRTPIPLRDSLEILVTIKEKVDLQGPSVTHFIQKVSSLSTTL